MSASAPWLFVAPESSSASTGLTWLYYKKIRLPVSSVWLTSLSHTWPIVWAWIAGAFILSLFKLPRGCRHPESGQISTAETFKRNSGFLFSFCCCCLITKLCPQLCDPTDYSAPGSPVLHHLPEFVQIHVHWVSVPAPSNSDKMKKCILIKQNEN